MKSSVENEVYMKLVPFLAGYAVWIGLWVFAYWDFLDAISMAGVVWSMGYLLFFRWRDGIRAEAQELDAVNLNVRWAEGYVEPVSLVAEQWLKLKEPDVKAPLLIEPQYFGIDVCAQCGADLYKPVLEPEVKPAEPRRLTRILYRGRELYEIARGIKTEEPITEEPITEEPITEEAKKKALEDLKIIPEEPEAPTVPVKCWSCDWAIPRLKSPFREDDLVTDLYYSEGKFRNQHKNPYTGAKYNSAIFIHRAPRDRSFAKCGGQWIFNQGLMLTGVAGNLDVTYVGFKEELEHKPVFVVNGDPDITRKIQIGLGIATEEAGKLESSAMEASNISSNREAVHYRLELREVKAENVQLKSSWEHSRDQAYRLFGRALKDIDIITNPARLTTKIKDRYKEIFGVIAGLLVLYLVASYFGWI